MAVRALRYAPEGHLEDMNYLIAHLMADPQAADIALGVEAASAALKTQSEDWNLKRRAVEEAQTGLTNVEEALRNVVRAAHNVILNDVGHTRRSSKFLTYFPRGLSPFVSVSYVDGLRAARSLADLCTQDTSPKIQEQAALLQAAADQMSSAYERRAAAQVAETVSYSRLQVQKLLAIDACRSAGYRLSELYPNNRDRVGTYFRRVYRRPRPAVPGAGEPTPAADTGAKAPPAEPALVVTSTAATP
jgi:hypothetical protein